jgi:hypothetical protein
MKSSRKAMLVESIEVSTIQEIAAGSIAIAKGSVEVEK